MNILQEVGIIMMMIPATVLIIIGIGVIITNFLENFFRMPKWMQVATMMVFIGLILFIIGGIK